MVTSWHLCWPPLQKEFFSFQLYIYILSIDPYVLPLETENSLQSSSANNGQLILPQCATVLELQLYNIVCALQ